MAIGNTGYHSNWDIESLVRAAAYKNTQMARDPKRSLSKTLLQRQFWYALKLDFDEENGRRAAGMINVIVEPESVIIDGTNDSSAVNDDIEENCDSYPEVTAGRITVSAVTKDEREEIPKEESHDLICALQIVGFETSAAEHELHLGLTPIDCPPSLSTEQRNVCSDKIKDTETVDPFDYSYDHTFYHTSETNLEDLETYSSLFDRTPAAKRVGAEIDILEERAKRLRGCGELESFVSSYSLFDGSSCFDFRSICAA